MKKFKDIVSKDKVSGFEASARNSIANRKHLDEEFELKLKKLTEEKVMKKQTAVEWLFDRFNMLFMFHEGIPNELQKAYEQAKEMDKAQKIDAYHTAQIEILDSLKEHGLFIGNHNREDKTGAEQYYKETYED
jgi:ABC-type Zn uptake system ZnuABC Zn-binding protein ZnuA